MNTYIPKDAPEVTLFQTSEPTFDDQGTSKRILNVSGVTYPSGWIACCYALEANGTAACITVKRAQELQQEGIPFVSGRFTPDDFAVFFPPDFQPIGASG